MLRGARTVNSEFDHDLGSCSSSLAAAREELLGVVTALSDDHLDRSRRGGWTVRRVLEHVIQSEWVYSRLVAHLRGLPVSADVIDALPASTEDALDRLGASRRALLNALDGVDEESFYRLGKIAHEEYSVLSVLENEINHDHEHAEQIRTIVGIR